MRAILLLILIAAVVIYFVYIGKSAKGSKTNIEKEMGALNQAMDVSLESQFTSLMTALNAYVSETGNYPDSLEMLIPGHIRSSSLLIDPWGTPIRLESSGQEGFSLVSAGPDRRLRTPDDRKRRFQ